MLKALLVQADRRPNVRVFRSHSALGRTAVDRRSHDRTLFGYDVAHSSATSARARAGFRPGRRTDGERFDELVDVEGPCEC